MKRIFTWLADKFQREAKQVYIGRCPFCCGNLYLDYKIYCLYRLTGKNMDKIGFHSDGGLIHKPYKT